MTKPPIFYILPIMEVSVESRIKRILVKTLAGSRRVYNYFFAIKNVLAYIKHEPVVSWLKKSWELSKIGLV